MMYEQIDFNNWWWPEYVYASYPFSYKKGMIIQSANSASKACRNSKGKFWNSSLWLQAWDKRRKGCACWNQNHSPHTIVLIITELFQIKQQLMLLNSELMTTYKTIDSDEVLNVLNNTVNNAPNFNGFLYRCTIIKGRKKSDSGGEFLVGGSQC